VRHKSIGVKKSFSSLTQVSFADDRLRSTTMAPFVPETLPIQEKILVLHSLVNLCEDREVF
jgi:hypothetical protein